MSHKTHVAVVTAALAMILAMAVVEPVPAQMLVFDPSNYSQNLLTAARSLQQIQSQITSLQNQAQMLINQAKQLEQLPTTVLNDVERDYSQIQNLLKQANGITYNVQSLNQAYAQRFPVSISSATTDLQMIASAQQRWQELVVGLPAFAHARRRRGAKPAQHAGANGLPAREQSILRWRPASNPGRQSAGRAANKAAGGSDRFARSAGPLPGAGAGAQSGSRGPGSGAVPPLLEPRSGLPAANRTDVSLRRTDGREHGLAPWRSGFVGSHAVRRCLRVA